MVSIGIIVLYRKRTPTMVFFALLVFSSAIYAFGYAMELTRAFPETINTWTRVEYMAMPFIASFLFLFILHFTAGGRRIPRLLIVVPLLISLVIMVIRQTNHLHWAYYSYIEYLQRDGFMVMVFGKALWYWIFAVYNVVGIVFSAMLMGSYLYRAPKVFRAQATLLLLGTLVPAIPYLIYISGLFPEGIDIVPAALTFSTFVFYIAVFRYNVFALIPVGRDWLIETMSDAVVVLNKESLIVDVNPSARRVFGLRDTDPIGQLATEAMPLLNPGFDSGTRIKIDDRVWELTRTPLPETRSNPEGVLIVAHDVTELERLAREDVMTGLLNRHSWDVAAEIEISRLSRYKRFGSVIYIDLDHFKKVNDTYGHAAGDEILKIVGVVLKAGVRRPDLVGRYGGEEFVVFLPESNPEESFDVADRLRMELTKAVTAAGIVELPITGSFGVTGSLITDGMSLDDLVNRADKALYLSKERGRNRVSQL